jgi:hypothetical protein
MSSTRPALALVAVLLAAACGGPGPTGPAPASPAPAGTPSDTPAPEATPATPPAGTPAAGPDGGLDTALSDAGVVGQATLPDDTRGGRTGTHVIVGQRAAGSGCTYSFDGTEFTAVAWVDDAAEGELARLSVTVPTDDVPRQDGRTEGIDGRVSFDFASESGFGALYTGDSSSANEGRSSIDANRLGVLLSFDFEGVTWDDVAFSGQLLCALD